VAASPRPGRRHDPRAGDHVAAGADLAAVDLRRLDDSLQASGDLDLFTHWVENTAHQAG
jgi:hypothetical protein